MNDKEKKRKLKKKRKKKKIQIGHHTNIKNTIIHHGGVARSN
jgi:hypothetical protein